MKCRAGGKKCEGSAHPDSSYGLCKTCEREWDELMMQENEQMYQYEKEKVAA